jgi:hypothetical protein
MGVLEKERSLLAVVGGRKEQANEVVACFARQGDRVAVRWYASTREFLGAESKPAFEAVIFFSPSDPGAGETEEAALRSVAPGVPVYRL